jgi:hypothetical protein
MFGVVLVASAS